MTLPALNKATPSRFVRRYCQSFYWRKSMSASINSAVAVATPDVALFNGAPIESSLIETLEQLGRDYQTAEDAQATAIRSLSKCDVALFDIVKGLPYNEFKTVRGFVVNGLRDKGSPSDEAAGKTWERAINRIGSSCGFERPKATSEAAERMAKKRAEQAAKFADKSDGELVEQRAELAAKGDTKSLAQARLIAKELETREKPAIDAAQALRQQLRDKLIARAKELCKAGTADADNMLIAALQAVA
jgi:hypothetical protein